MKNKSFILLFFLIFFFNHTFSQVSIDGITVNNVGVSGTTINLGTTLSSNIYLNAAVSLTSAQNDNNPGTIKIYYKKTSSSPAIIANGGDGGYLLFNGGTFAVRSFYLNLNSAQFNTTGGILYAEYKTYAGTITKSPNISIVKNTTGGEPGGQPGEGCVICYHEIVPYGGIPILPLTAWEHDPLYISNWYTQNNGEEYLYELKELYGALSLEYKEPNSPSTYRTYTAYAQRPYNSPDNYIKRLNISNTIEKTQSIPLGNSPQTIIGTQGLVNDQINNNYQWQERKVSPHDPTEANYGIWYDTYGWKDIPNATQMNYAPSSNPTEVKAYRRLLIQPSNNYYRLSMASNVVTVYVETTDSNLSNTICCDNTYNTNATINPLTGSNIGVQYYIQWQKGIMTNNEIIWYDIDKAFSKDYTPTRPGGRAGNSSGTYYYRRTLTHRLSKKFYASNIVTIIFSNTSGKMSNITQKKSTEESITEKIKIYPNPATESINIESKYDLSSFNIKMTDITGRLIILKKSNELNGHSEQLDISELPAGLYNIIIDNGQDKIIKKVIKK